MKPIYYHKQHIQWLQGELKNRYVQLMAALDDRPLIVRSQECVVLNGPKIRTSVDDFKSILAEVRRLK